MLEKHLNDLITQHVISTTMLELDEEDNNDKMANSTAYLTSNTFGQGNLTGQVLNFYGEEERVFKSRIQG